jgi:hypothetical protein
MSCFTFSHLKACLIKHVADVFVYSTFLYIRISVLGACLVFEFKKVKAVVVSRKCCFAYVIVAYRYIELELLLLFSS